MKITKKYIFGGIITAAVLGFSAYKQKGLKTAAKVITGVVGIFMYAGGLMEFWSWNFMM